MIKHYMKAAIRSLWRHKSYTFINIVGFSVGLTCCILILLFVRYEVSYDRYHEHADQIYRIVMGEDNEPSIARVGSPWGPAAKEEIPEVVDYVRFRYAPDFLIKYGETAFYETGGLYTDPQIFDIFTFAPVFGNPGSALVEPNSVVLNQSLAQKFFGERNPVGETLQFGQELPLKVKAVVADVPANSHFKFDFLLPFQLHEQARPDWMGGWTVGNYHVYIMTRPAVDIEQLNRSLQALFASKTTEKEAGQRTPLLQPLTSIHLHSNLFREFEPNGNILTVYIFIAVAALVLLIACINFTNLATARATKRTREIGIRKVTGARRGQLVAQFLGEALILSFASLAIAIGLIEATLPYFNQVVGQNLVLTLTDPALAATLLVITLAVGILSGGYPAAYLSSLQPATVLKGGSGAPTKGIRMRKSLVVFQFAASIALIVCSLLVLDQLNFLRNKNPGFDLERILVVPINDPAMSEHQTTVRNELEKLRHVASVSLTSGTFGGGDWGVPIKVSNSTGLVETSTRMLVVDHNYLDMMGMQLVEGRNFSHDFPTDLEGAVILNETAAQSIGTENVVGSDIQVASSWKKGKIIGIVKDFNFRSLHEEVKPLILFIDKTSFNYFFIKILPGDYTATLSAIENIWQQFSPDYPFQYSFLDQTFEEFYQKERKLSLVIRNATGLAILIACIGLLGLAAFSAEQRTREIGVRKVLGASVPQIIVLLSRDFARLIVLANIIAWPLAYWFMHGWLANFAYRIDIGPGVFILSGVIGLLLALLTVTSQAAKTSLANPVHTLRHE